MANVFGWIQVAYIDSFSEYPSPQSERVPVGHAGRGETQLIMGSLPGTVRMQALGSLAQLPRWLEDAEQADADQGRWWIEFCAQGWARELSRGTTPPDGAPA
jgi:hypothetical protein